MQDVRPGELDHTAIRKLLTEIGTEFAREELSAEVAIYGGSAILLIFSNRKTTRDIDYVLVSGDKEKISEITDRVGKSHGLKSGWFNDAVQIFKSAAPDHEFFGDFPTGNPSGLRVFTATPQYILAMKMMAMRSSLETNDVLDTWNLIDACGINNANEAYSFFKKFYPYDELKPRNIEIINQLFEDKRAGKTYDAMNYW